MSRGLWLYRDLRLYRGNIYRRRKAEAGGLNTPARHTRERTWGGKSILRLQVYTYIDGPGSRGRAGRETRSEAGRRTRRGRKTRRARGLGEARRTGNRELEPETEIAKKRTGGLVEGARKPKRNRGHEVAKKNREPDLNGTGELQAPEIVGRSFRASKERFGRIGGEKSDVGRRINGVAVRTEERRNTNKIVRESGVGTHAAVDRKTAVRELERAAEGAVGVQGSSIRKRESEGRKDLGGEEVGEGGAGAATKEDVSSTSITDQNDQ